MADTTKTNHFTDANTKRKDEYRGQYKDPGQGKSPAEQWGTNQLPVTQTPTPWKGLKQAGG